jgi:hypothetical protein
MKSVSRLWLCFPGPRNRALLEPARSLRAQKAHFSVSKSLGWNRKDRPRILEERAIAKMEKQSQAVDYTGWTNEELIKRVTALESELKQKNAAYVSM